uniref:Cytospin-A n=1 Tax=Poecilia reticulata TaxID=8081 RepID=A0A3P9NH94_POERE
MLKSGATKGGLPKPGLQERVRQASLTSSTSTSAALRNSRSSNTLASDQRLSKLKRASSDDALTKPALGAAAAGSRMKKTVTTGGISDLAEARPRSLSGRRSTTKKSGIPAPREISSSITRDRVSLRDQLRSSSTKRIVTSSSTSSLSTLAKQTRSSTKPRADAESQERGLLESQVKELLAEAKAKDLEIDNLRTELQHCKSKTSPASSLPSPSSVSDQAHAADGEQGQVAEALVLVGELREKNGRFQRELAGLREENQTLKEKLICLEASPLSSKKTSSSVTLVNGVPSEPSASQKDKLVPTASPLKTSVSSSSDITKDSPSPDSSEFEKLPSRSESGSSSSGGGDDFTAVRSGGQDASVQRLTEQIHKMEESHHSTAEELQATLQELADQQQMVQELTAENERLAEEKRLLQTSLQQQRERLEVMAQKNETLAVRVQEQAQAQAQREQELGSQGPRLAELEQRYAELVESSRFEREKLVDIQQQLTGSLRALEEEHQEAQGQVCCLKEELDRLQAQLDKEVESSSQVSQAAEEHKATAECLRLENSRLKAQVDIERQKVGELKAMQSASDSTELQNMLKTAHSERDKLEVELTELRQELLKAQAETEHVRATVEKDESDLEEQELSDRVTSLEEAGVQAENQVKEMKETIFELEDQVEQQRAVNCHTNQAVLDMENLVKKIEEQKGEAERQLKVLNRQMKEEREEWRRFQADLQTAVVVANDIKVEAQQELRTLRRQLQEEQDRNAKLSADLQAMQGVRYYPPEDASEDASSEPGATVKSLIKSFDTVGPNGPCHTVPVLPTPRSPLSGIPVRSAPAAAVSPIQVPKTSACIKKSHVGFGGGELDKLSGFGEDLKPNSLMRKSPSLESVIKSPISLSSRTASFSYSRGSSKLSVERTDPLAALAREYGGSKRNALLKWCQKKTEGYPNIDVTNFSSSWSDGLAFCALLHTYLPAHIPYQELISQDKVRNLTLAFQAAESIGIKTSLLMKTDRPDWQSVMQYVSQIYKYFET